MRGCACIAVFFSKLQHISIDRNIVAYSSLPSAALFSDACIIFVVTGLVCALIRWFHMCPGYLDNEAVYYPARKQMAAFFAMPVFLLPYVFRPSDPLVMTYSVSVLLIDVSLSVTVLYRIYFRWDLVGRTSWRKIFQCFSFSWISAFLLGVVLFPRFCSHYEKWIIGGTAIIGMVLTIMAGSTVLRLKGDIDRYVNNNYSNPEDFPLKFARQVLYLPLVFILAGWVLFLTRNPWLLFSLNILYSIVFVWILCVILYPQDGRALPESQTEICTPPDLCCEEGSVEDEVLSIIGRHFKEPHLLKTEVLSEVSRGNVRKADRFITLYGYYRLVNMFRLEYARLYKLSNPDAIQDLIASESGFTSRVTFYKARKSVGEISEEVSSRVKKLF